MKLLSKSYMLYIKSLKSLKSLKPTEWFRSKTPINPEQERREKLQDIGSHLQQIRREKGISLEEISQITHIQFRLLKAIEEGKLDSLPEPIYIREFLKQFAHVLGLDGTELANDFPTHLSATKVSSNFIWLRLPSLQLRPIHLYFFYILLVVFSVKGLSNQLKQETWSEWQPETQPQQAVQPVIQSQPPQAAIKPPSTVKQDADKAVVVDVQIKDDCWLKVVVDGKTEFEGTLPQGTHRTWVASQKLTVKAGNAGGVFVAVNDEQAKQLGQPGQIQEVTFQVNPQS